MRSVKYTTVAVLIIAVSYAGYFYWNNLPDVGNAAEKIDLIRVIEPDFKSPVSSPLFIKGVARGFWFFEASFPVILLDEHGDEITSNIAEAQSSWMTENFVPFKTVLQFSKPASKRGLLIFKKDNPSGLSEYDDELRIPVAFKNND